MSRSLAAIRCYGYRLIGGHAIVDGDKLLDQVAGVRAGSSIFHAEAARLALGVRFELHGWEDQALVVTASLATVYDEGIVALGRLTVDPAWDAKLDRVVDHLRLQVRGPAQWYALARWY